MQEDVFVIVGKLSDHGSGKIQGQVAEQGLLLFERKVPQCLGRLERIGSLRQSHSHIPMGLRNRIPKSPDVGFEEMNPRWSPLR